jgi:plastocyanin
VVTYTVRKEIAVRILAASAVIVAMLAGFVACGSNSGNPVSAPPSTDHTKVVEMQDNVFSPKDVTVAFGDTVQWVNVGNNGHSTTSGASCTADGEWDSGVITKGQSFTVIFDATHVNKTGTLPYFCIPHCALSMVGTVTVTP